MSTRNVDPNNRDFESSINARPVTRDEVAYRDGYVRGQSAEQLAQDHRRAAEARIHEENARLRADNGVSTGLILGFVLAGVAAVFGGVLYLYNQDVPGVAPTPEATSPDATNNDTTIIERTIERSQEVVPAPGSGEPPQVNVELTNPFEQAPTPAPASSPQPAADPNQVPSQNPEAQ